MSITLKQLKIFHAVAQHNNIQRAADVLFLSKSAISMALQELEKRLGKTLFDRINNRLYLNHEGMHLLPLADELLQRAEQIELSFLQQHQFNGTLRIGASNSIGNYLLPALLGDFLTCYPGCIPKITIANTQVLAEQMVDFKLDICLVEGNTNISNILWQNWLKDEIYLICHPHHPLAQKQQTEGPLIREDFNQQSWVLREAGSAAREHFNLHIAPHLASWSLRLELNQSEAIIQACRASLGIGYLPNQAVFEEIQQGKLSRLNYPFNTTRQLKIGIHQSKYISPLLQKFHDFCMDWHPTSLQP